MTFPARPVDLVVPFPPAGITHFTAERLAAFLTRHWKQPVQVVNMPGEGGATGTLHVLRAAPDGHTMLMLATGQATQNPALDARLPYRWDDPLPVARTNLSPLVFVVAGDSPWRTLREAMDAVRSNPEGYRYGTSGVGGVGSIALARLLDAAAVDPSRTGRVTLHGGHALLEAVIHGQTHFAAQYLAEMRQQLDAGTLRPLAVSSSTRVPSLPDVPTGIEAGFPAFSLVGWNGVAGPRGLPPDVVDAWDAGIAAFTRDPEFLAWTAATGGLPRYLPPSDFAQALQREYEDALAFAMRLGMRRT